MYLLLIFIVKITCGIELAMSGTISKPNFQGRRLRKWKLYDKSSQREKGKCPKDMTKDVIKKEGNFWKRRVYFPFGDLEKYVRTKVGKF